MQAVERPLEEGWNGIDEACGQVVFTDCRVVDQGELEVLVIESSPADDTKVVFRDADAEVCFSWICIGERGNLRTVLQNRWEGDDAGGYYSLLHHARELRIFSNSQAACDLLAYVEGRYELGEHWQRQELGRDVRVLLWPPTDPAAVRGLRQHFATVEMRDIGAPLGGENAVDEDCNHYTFKNCREAVPQNFTVDARLSDSGWLLEFSHADGEVHIPSITIGPRGSLASVVCNHWWNGKGGDEDEEGYYSLLPHARQITIRGNPGAVRDLLAYVRGEYEVGGDWAVQPLDRAVCVAVEGVDGCGEDLCALAEHFGAVRVDGQRLLGETLRRPLRECCEHEAALRPLRARVRAQRGELTRLVGLSTAMAEGVRLAQQRLWRARERLAAALALAE